MGCSLENPQRVRIDSTVGIQSSPDPNSVGIEFGSSDIYPKSIPTGDVPNFCPITEVFIEQSLSLDRSANYLRGSGVSGNLDKIKCKPIFTQPVESL